MKQPDLGLKIIELRQNKGLTQEELVKQCNLSVRTLQRIESGEAEPRGYTLRLISKALDFDLLNLSLNNSIDHSSKASEPLNLDYMNKLEKTKDVLIRRYASLNFSSVEKMKLKLENNPIDDIIEKHNNALTFGIVLLTATGVSVVIQFILLFASKDINFSLIFNVLVLLFFQRGLNCQYEIKHILKALKEIE